MKNTKGFTLIELLIVVAILGVVLSGMAGMANSYLTNAKVSESVDELREGLMLARLEAIKRNTTVDFTATTNGSWAITLPLEANNELHSKVSTTTAISVTDATGSTTNLLVSFMGSGRPVTPLTYYTFPASPMRCKADGGEVTCKQVSVVSGGQIKICNPSSDVEAYRC